MDTKIFWVSTLLFAAALLILQPACQYEGIHKIENYSQKTSAPVYNENVQK